MAIVPIQHEYMSGNFAPVSDTHSFEPCYCIGRIPRELSGGQYVRNGGNPVITVDIPGKAHWYDGDGMLSGVYFRSSLDGAHLVAEYSNQYTVTDVLLATMDRPTLEEPIPLSIATLLNPNTTLGQFLKRLWRMSQTIVTSYWQSHTRAIKRISVANTNIIYHDGRALALCESGPPLRVSLPSLETVGWFNGLTAEGEPMGNSDIMGFGHSGLFRLFQEMTTAHPCVDPHTHEMILFHSVFMPPYVSYSVLPKRNKMLCRPANMFLNVPVPGLSSPKVMHDFGVSRKYTVMIDLPLTIEWSNLWYTKPVINFDGGSRTAFGIFPRYNPDEIRWFHTDACCIFHTVNTWDTEPSSDENGLQPYVNMLVCRMNTPAILYTTADLDPPVGSDNSAQDETPQCRLYYYQFDLTHPWNLISHQWALSAIPFEFPHVPKHRAMSATRYVYGCSTTKGCFGTALGQGVKINCLVKVDTSSLIQQGLKAPPDPIVGCVDCRSVHDIVYHRKPNDPISIFQLPVGWYAQECSFVPRQGSVDEDDGWLLSFVFDESQLDSAGVAVSDARSELWIIDARSMQTVIARLVLPQRVPYGMHGNWFSREEIEDQRAVESYRRLLRK
ncbi:9-cis-epoxycarotenoid dioxygenase [Aspergillus pseudotamarii]|uniref:9-cis-epoxycarotenoid dioxygenase n=1 Tax=Aspergillus pseudotamarii TaxID=132259 RepID=A0A5N6T8Y8_ASPPS|nr:9-cis-epoxycarotenoid dioxygenase [Aspergillus pseudotamarii]KAE8142838.1 9-cis-epoxycarotenoid dioxygenase [Aspergillus pseudotamarii]